MVGLVLDRLVTLLLGLEDIRDVIEISSKPTDEKSGKKLSRKEREELIARLTREMKNAAKLLEFEHAAYLRERIKALRNEV